MQRTQWNREIGIRFASAHPAVFVDPWLLSDTIGGSPKRTCAPSDARKGDLIEHRLA